MISQGSGRATWNSNQALAADPGRELEQAKKENCEHSVVTKHLWGSSAVQEKWKPKRKERSKKIYLVTIFEIPHYPSWVWSGDTSKGVLYHNDIRRDGGGNPASSFNDVTPGFAYFIPELCENIKELM